jgi:hypothetical protein
MSIMNLETKVTGDGLAIVTNARIFGRIPRDIGHLRRMSAARHPVVIDDMEYNRPNPRINVANATRSQEVLPVEGAALTRRGDSS